MGGRVQIFDKYAKDTKCFDRKEKIITFLSWEKIKQINKFYLTNLLSDDPKVFLKTTWLNAQNSDFIFDCCAVKECNNTDIVLDHVRHFTPKLL